MSVGRASANFQGRLLLSGARLFSVVRPHFGTHGTVASRHRSGGYKGHGIDLERRTPWTSTTTTNRPSFTEKIAMTGGEKRAGSPLEGGTTKLFIVGLGDHKMPSPRVARPQEPTEVTEVSDSFHRADAPAEGPFFHCCRCFLTPNDAFANL